MIKHFIKVDKVTARIIGTHNGALMPVLAEASSYYFEEVPPPVANQVTIDLNTSAAEFRSLKLVGGNPVLGAVPDSVGRIDISINPVLVPGVAGSIELMLLGAGPLTVTIAGTEYALTSGNREISIPMSIS